VRDKEFKEKERKRGIGEKERERSSILLLPFLFDANLRESKSMGCNTYKEQERSETEER
jgi:hypothetical protein